jgi:hypothetical protein
MNKAQLDERLRSAAFAAYYLDSEIRAVNSLAATFCDAIRAQRLFNMTPGTKVRLSNIASRNRGRFKPRYEGVVESVDDEEVVLEGGVAAHIDDVEVME